MKKIVKNIDDKMYEKNEFNRDESIKAAQEIKKEKKRPTSVALTPQTISDLKELAEKKGIPYQILMRSYILEGLEKEKKKSA